MPPVSSGDLFVSVPDLLHDAVQSSDVAPATPASSRPRRACAPTSLGQMLRVAYDRLIPPKVFGVDTKKRKHVRDSDDDVVVPSVKRKSSSVVRHPAASNESSPSLGRSAQHLLKIMQHSKLRSLRQSGLQDIVNDDDKHALIRCRSFLDLADIETVGQRKTLDWL